MVLLQGVTYTFITPRPVEQAEKRVIFGLHK